MQTGLKRHFGMVIHDFFDFLALFVQKLGCQSKKGNFGGFFAKLNFLGFPRFSSAFLGFPRLSPRFSSVFLGFPRFSSAFLGLMFCPRIPSISKMVSQPQLGILDLIFGCGRRFWHPKVSKKKTSWLFGQRMDKNL